MTGLIILIIVIALIAIPAIAISYYALAQRRRAGAALLEAVPAARPLSLADRLSRSRRAIGGRLGALLARGRLDDEFWNEVEETLIAADAGTAAAADLVGKVRAADPGDPEEARRLLRDELVAAFGHKDRHLAPIADPAVIVVVGVNGSGKTTSIAKLAARYQALGAEPLLGAADTFRAAADEQLRLWARDVGAEIVGGSPGADPAAVAFDAYQAAKARGKDVLIVDTAGRLHSDRNLMSELAKVVRVLEQRAGRVDEVLLILDGTGGQNGIAQAETFTEAVGVTGVVITKLDGTAKGGIAVAIETQLGIPVKLIGVGETVEDLVPFEPEAFVDALLEEDE